MAPIAWNKIMCSLICTDFEVNEQYSGHRRLFFQELLTQGFRYVGPLANQVSGQNSKLLRPGGQIIQGTQFIQGPLDHCTGHHNLGFTECTVLRRSTPCIAFLDVVIFSSSPLLNALSTITSPAFCKFLSLLQLRRRACN